MKTSRTQESQSAAQTIQSLKNQISEVSKSTGTLDQALKKESERSLSLSDSLKQSQGQNEVLQKEKLELLNRFTNLQSQLQATNLRNTEESKALKNEITESSKSIAAFDQALKKASGEKDQALQRLSSLQSELEILKAGRLQESQSAAQTIQNLNNQIQALKVYAQKMQAEASKVSLLKEEAMKWRAERQAIQAQYAAMANNYQLQNQTLKEYDTNLRALKTVNAEFERSALQTTKAIKILRENVKSDFSEAQNLKSNFEEYLESLVSNFTERLNQSRKSDASAASNEDLQANLSDLQNLRSNFKEYLESLVSNFKERQDQ